MLDDSARSETADREHPVKLDPGRYIRLSVADTGAGMDEATMAQAIEPFFSTKGIGKGTGLGLSMVDGLAVAAGRRPRAVEQTRRGDDGGTVPAGERGADRERKACSGIAGGGAGDRPRPAGRR